MIRVRARRQLAAAFLAGACGLVISSSCAPGECVRHSGCPADLICSFGSCVEPPTDGGLADGGTDAATSDASSDGAADAAASDAAPDGGTDAAADSGGWSDAGGTDASNTDAGTDSGGWSDAGGTDASNTDAGTGSDGGASTDGN